jgi:hypothetical protein
MLEYLVNDFSASHTSDASGDKPWESSLTISFPKETTYRGVVDTLVNYGLINWCTEGNTFRVFDNGADGTVSDDQGMQVDRTDGDDPVTLVFGRECIDGPQQISRRGMASLAWVLGDNNTSWLREKTDTFIRRGKRAIAISQGGANEGIATLVGDRSLNVAAVARQQLTRTLNFDTAQFLPWFDYKPGDWVFAPGKSNGHIERLRVAQITLVFSAGAATSGSIVLNDRIYERAVVQQRQLDAMSNGAIISGSTGSATKPSPPGRTPAIPGKKTDGTTDYAGLSGAAYVDSSGHTRVVINITIPTVNSDVNGQAIDLDHYEVRVRKRVK